MAAIKGVDVEQLLKDQRVIDEITRHLWIESEKAGRDIGFEEAKVDWLKKFSKVWMQYNMPEALVKPRKSESAPKVKEAKAAVVTAPRKRRAKSYL